MMVNPFNLAREAEGLSRVGVTDAFERLAIDKRSIVVTPIHVAANRLRELVRGDGRHGSCGQGVGEAMWDALNKRVIRVGDLSSPDLADKLLAMLRAKQSELAQILRKLDPDLPDRGILDEPDNLFSLAEDYADFVERVRIVDHRHLHDLHEQGVVIYEGAQGVLLDQDHGFHPHTTWARTTYANANALIRPNLFANEWETIGVLRAYSTRHGPGPFPTEDTELELPDATNGRNRWQGSWRVGHFDAVLSRYAIAATGPVSGLALTCLDRIGDEWDLCSEYHYEGSLPDLKAYFELRGRRTITGLKVSPYLASHAHTEALTNRLVDCRPFYTT
jgi:adenylosuccinate synthase